MISDLVTNKEINKDSVDAEKLCSCIDGALTKENYLNSIIKAGFKNVEVIEEKTYLEEQEDNNTTDPGRKISSLIIKAVKD